MRMSRAQRSQQVVQLLHKHGPMSARKAAHLLDVVEDTARSFMRRAYLAGQIKCCQHKRMAVWHMEGQEEVAQELCLVLQERRRRRQSEAASARRHHGPMTKQVEVTTALHQRDCSVEQALVRRLRSLYGQPRTARELARMESLPVPQVEEALHRLRDAGLAHTEPGAWVEAGAPEHVVEVTFAHLKTRRADELRVRRGRGGQWNWMDKKGRRWTSAQEKYLALSLGVDRGAQGGAGL